MEDGFDATPPEGTGISEARAKESVGSVLGFAALSTAVFVGVLFYLKFAVTNKIIVIDVVYTIIKVYFFFSFMANASVVQASNDLLCAFWEYRNRAIGGGFRLVAVLLLTICLVVGVWLPFYFLGFENVVNDFFYPELDTNNTRNRSLFERKEDSGLGYQIDIVRKMKGLPAIHWGLVSIPMFISAVLCKKSPTPRR